MESSTKDMPGLEVGKFAAYAPFSLQEAMSAVELMDPKMDR